jgi:hypothetical protein
MVSINANHTNYYDHTNAAHTVAYKNAEESLRQAAILTNRVFHQLTTEQLMVTATEAATMDALLQDLVLHAAAVGGCIRQQQQQP